MRIDYLYYLLVIDKNRSITGAARELYMTQTGLTSILNRVEEELGTQVFSRSRSGVTPTEDGKEILSIAWDIWSQWSAALELNRETSVSEPVNVLTAPSISCAVTIPLLDMMQEKEQMNNLLFQEVDEAAVASSIVNNHANVGLTYFTQKSLQEFQPVAQKYGIRIKPLLRDALYVILRCDHPLAKRKSLCLADIRGQQLAFLPHFQSDDYAALYQQMLDNGNRTIVFPNISLVKEAVLRGNMVTFLNGFSFRQDASVDSSSLCALPLADNADNRELILCVVHQKLSNLQSRERIMVECIEQYFSSLNADE